MYLLKCLQDAGNQTPKVEVEYRLACSGEFYNRKVVTFDWRKSDMTRVLLEHPFPLFVTSRPFDSYPQELCVRIPLNFVREEAGRGSRVFLPDDDVVEDLCAILSLLSRRLVSVVAKTREKNDASYTARWYKADIPMPILDHAKVDAWPRRPGTILTSLKGQEFKSNDPPSVGVDPDALSKFLIELPSVPNAEQIVHAARLYKSALELINDRHDTAYLTLVSVVESLANLALNDFEPDEAEKVKSKSAMVKRARAFGLDEAQAKALALEACKGQTWLKRKFKKFCIDFCDVEDLKRPDRVFLVLKHLNPPDDEFEKALGRIYDARSKILHEGLPLPSGIGIGTSLLINVLDLPVDPLRRPEIPPLPWFERIVSTAARTFLVPTGPAPFADWNDGGQ
jgi:hypothetical protein